MLENHLHLGPMLRMPGDIRLLYPNVSSWRVQGQIYLHF